MTLAQQRRYDALASGLLLFGTIVATTINYFTKQGFWSPTLSHRGLMFLILLQPFYLWMVYGIWKGRRWAKIVYLVLTGIGILGLLFTYDKVFPKLFTSPLAIANVTGQNILSLVVSVLLILSIRRPESELIEWPEAPAPGGAS